MKCSKCGARMPTGLAICPECGATVGKKVRYVRCRYCGARVPRGLHICPQCGRVPTLRGRVSLLVVTVVLGIALGSGATFAGQKYLPEVRYRLGVMLLDASGKQAGDGPGQLVPTVTPTP
jgi:RNA polymerase subunit RPABC4/transcription elongation factor Spt4